MLKIEVLHLLLLIEACGIFFALALFLFFRGRKIRNMYERSVSDLAEAQRVIDTLERRTHYSTESQTLQMEKGALNPSETVPAMAEQRARQRNAEQEDSSGPVVSDKSLRPQFVPVQTKLDKLKSIIGFQKGQMAELMCYKDLFEGAQKRLAALQVSNFSLQEKVGDLAEKVNEKDRQGFDESLMAFESNNSEIQAFMRVIEKENSNLSNKFATWEQELKQRWDEFEAERELGEWSRESGEGTAPSEGAVSQEEYERLLKEKDALAAEASSLKKELQDKGSQLSQAIKDYEDLEREYLNLYRQQQGKN